MSEDADRCRRAYEVVPYPGTPHPQTHPDRLAVIATLFGLHPAPPERCRVLELGCGDGANLIPMAFSLPDSRFLGVDFARSAVSRAKAAIAALKLGNVEVRAMDLRRLEAQPESFDYVIAHGVYSWAPEQVRQGIFAVARRVLAPHGVAYVSYNTYPGTYLRRMLRDMLLYHARNTDEPGARIRAAYEMLWALNESKEGEDPYRTFVLAEVRRLVWRPAASLYHDELAEVYHPVYFHEFIREAERFGLRYLGEADYWEMRPPAMPPPVRQLFERAEGDRIAFEQYVDFLRCRAFRRTLLCRQEAEVDPEGAVQRVPALRVASAVLPGPGGAALAPDQPAEYCGPKGWRVWTLHPLSRIVLDRLAEVWPAALDFEELLASVRAGHANASSEELAAMLLQAYASDVVEFRLVRRDPAPRAGPRPEAWRLARWQAERQTEVTSLRHTLVRLEGDLEQRLLILLDGSRDRAQLLAELGMPDLTAEQLEAALQRLARLGLFVC